MVLTEDAAAISPLPPTLSRAHATNPRRRWLRVIAVISIVLIILCVAGLGGTGWYFSSQALAVSPDHPSYNYHVLALHRDTVTIPQTGTTVRPGTYRLQWRGGQVILGEVISKDGQAVIRQFTGNTQGLRVGTLVHVDAFIYDSPAALGIRSR